MDIPGSIAISARALNQTVRAIAADELRVNTKDVVVKLADDHGLLAVTVASPLRVPRLGSTGNSGIVQRCESARNGIHTRTTDLTGGRVRTVTIRVTRGQVMEERRVS